jgi:hypothetical protein
LNTANVSLRPRLGASSAIPARCGGYRERAGWNDADHEHAAPADVLKEKRVDDRGEKISGRVARLQEAGNKAACLRRDAFHGERCPNAPFAAHGDAVDRAQHQERGQVRREARGEFDQRVEQHVDHQGRPPAPAVGRTAEQEGADRPHRQGQQDGDGDVGHIGVEFPGDVREHENQQEKIERVERPSQEACGDHVFLLGRPAGKCRDAHGSSLGVYASSLELPGRRGTKAVPISSCTISPF